MLVYQKHVYQPLIIVKYLELEKYHFYIYKKNIILNSAANTLKSEFTTCKTMYQSRLDFRILKK